MTICESAASKHVIISVVVVVVVVVVVIVVGGVAVGIAFWFGMSLINLTVFDFSKLRLLFFLSFSLIEVAFVCEYELKYCETCERSWTRERERERERERGGGGSCLVLFQVSQRHRFVIH